MSVILSQERYSFQEYLCIQSLLMIADQSANHNSLPWNNCEVIAKLYVCAVRYSCRKVGKSVCSCFTLLHGCYFQHIFTELQPLLSKIHFQMCLISEGFWCLSLLASHCEEKVGSAEGDSNDH